jgi:hypothetical protein
LNSLLVSSAHGKRTVSWFRLNPVHIFVCLIWAY